MSCVCMLLLLLLYMCIMICWDGTRQHKCIACAEVPRRGAHVAAAQAQDQARKQAREKTAVRPVAAQVAVRVSGQVRAAAAWGLAGQGRVSWGGHVQREGSAWGARSALHPVRALSSPLALPMRCPPSAHAPPPTHPPLPESRWGWQEQIVKGDEKTGTGCTGRARGGRRWWRRWRWCRVESKSGGNVQAAEGQWEGKGAQGGQRSSGTGT